MNKWLVQRLQASARNLEKEAEAALQKLSGSWPQFSEDLSSRVRGRGSSVHDLLVGGPSELTTALKSFWTQLEGRLGSNQGE